MNNIKKAIFKIKIIQEGVGPFLFGISNGFVDEPSIQCDAEQIYYPIYCATSTISTGSIFYSDIAMTTPVDGGNSWFRVFPGTLTWFINTVGVVGASHVCP